jgi:hypothetical protein
MTAVDCSYISGIGTGLPDNKTLTKGIVLSPDLTSVITSYSNFERPTAKSLDCCPGI